MSITTPLGPDVLLIEELDVDERVSGGFELVLGLVSERADIAAADLLTKAVTVTALLETGEKRHFHGIVRRFVQLGRDERLVSYRAEVVPSTWFLSLTSDCRIFQQKSSVDIVKQILTDAGITHVRDALTGTYTARDYCVQYRESHLAFISRLMEEEGIYYFFEHGEDSHTIVLADAPTAVKAGPVGVLPVRSERTISAEYYAYDVVAESVVTINKLALADNKDITPKRIASEIGNGAKSPISPLRIYDYPGGFDVKTAGDKAARTRMEAYEALGETMTGQANCIGLSSGQKLTLKEHYRGASNKAYHLLSVRHRGFVGGYRTSDDRRDSEFDASFVAIPAEVPYRPMQMTPRPTIAGTQTALVVGPSGEEIYVDKYGRVKVQFFWDELGKLDENSSCWVRVSSAWAGKQWGFIQLPRIGQEVIVEFLEGDPDRPIITGRVYNSELMPPYTLPDKGTQSGMLTRSSKGGTAENANELRFEDKKGSEEVYFNAEKDLNSIVENDETRKIGHDRTTTIKNNETKTVSDGNETTTIEKGNQTLTVAQGNQTIAVSQGDQTLTVDQGKQTVTINGNQAITIKQGNIATKVSLGNVTLKVDLGKITYEAMQEIQFKVGQNSVTIDQTGIKIKGMMVSVEGQVQTQIKAPITQVNGDGMLMLKGGITMIN